MITPTPVNKLSSFSAGGTVSSQPGSNKWLPYIIAGGVLVVAIGISMIVNKKIQRDRMNLKMKIKENERETT